MVDINVVKGSYHPTSCRLSQEVEKKDQHGSPQFGGPVKSFSAESLGVTDCHQGFYHGVNDIQLCVLHRQNKDHFEDFTSINLSVTEIPKNLLERARNVS